MFSKEADRARIELEDLRVRLNNKDLTAHQSDYQGKLNEYCYFALNDIQKILRSIDQRLKKIE